MSGNQEFAKNIIHSAQLDIAKLSIQCIAEHTELFVGTSGCNMMYDYVEHLHELVVFNWHQVFYAKVQSTSRYSLLSVIIQIKGCYSFQCNSQKTLSTSMKTYLNFVQHNKTRLSAKQLTNYDLQTNQIYSKIMGDDRK